MDKSALSKGEEFLTLREFELFRESQKRLENDKAEALEKLLNEKLDAIERRYAAMFSANEKALELAGEETGKRLDALNGEQARLAKDRERFLSRETYDVAQKEFGLWRDQVNANLSLGVGRDRGIGISWGVVVGAIGLLISITSIALVIFRFK